MKIKEVKFFNSVKVGRSEVIVASAYEGTNNKPAFEIVLKDNIIQIREAGTTEWTYTVIYNTVWFTEMVTVEQERVTVSKRDGEQSEDPDRRRYIRKTK